MDINLYEPIEVYNKSSPEVMSYKDDPQPANDGGSIAIKLILTIGLILLLCIFSGVVSRWIWLKRKKMAERANTQELND